MMNRTLKRVSVFGLAIAGLGLLSFAAQPAMGQGALGAKKQEQRQKDDEKRVKLNEKVPDFRLMDLEGNEHKLSDYKNKVIVLEWINPDCPYVKQCYKAEVMENIEKKLTSLYGKDNVAFLAVDSSAHKPKDAVIKGTKRFMKKHDDDRTVLLDYDGKVGKMFNARTTPHMYVIDQERKLRYHGAVTDDMWSRNDDRTNFVINALEKIKAGETVAPDYSKPWGCSVKYKSD